MLFTLPASISPKDKAITLRQVSVSSWKHTGIQGIYCWEGLLFKQFGALNCSTKAALNTTMQSSPQNI
ncbi:hypothetical protein AMECASPLE_030164 [Ameca splendens]|uniref:Uncharacterized protein n=1 Tax=Ameca splendens TaxID=208324 RepID=A0ABV0ZTL8_9TELE